MAKRNNTLPEIIITRTIPVAYATGYKMNLENMSIETVAVKIPGVPENATVEQIASWAGDGIVKVTDLIIKPELHAWCFSDIKDKATVTAGRSKGGENA